MYEKGCIFCGKKDKYKKGIKGGLTRARELRVNDLVRKAAIIKQDSNSGHSFTWNSNGIVMSFPSNLSIPRLQSAETAPVANAASSETQGQWGREKV